MGNANYRGGKPGKGQVTQGEPIGKPQTSRSDCPRDRQELGVTWLIGMIDIDELDNYNKES